jgi:hypothetical protein
VINSPTPNRINKFLDLKRYCINSCLNQFCQDLINTWKFIGYPTFWGATVPPSSRCQGMDLEEGAGRRRGRDTCKPMNQ